MTIDRYYKIEAVVRVPLDHEFPESVRSDCFMQYKGDTATSDLVLEEIRQLLERAMLPVESLSVGLRNWRVTDNSTGEQVVLRDTSDPQAQ